MNTNKITTNNFSNPNTKQLYLKGYEKNNPKLFKKMTENCDQCGGCSCFAPLNADYGICCNSLSKCYLETVFEHFTCITFVSEGWGSHSFCETEKQLKINEPASGRANDFSRWVKRALIIFHKRRISNIFVV